MLDAVRRNQKKILAIMAIVAMFLFTLGDALPYLFGPTMTQNREEAVLYGRKVMTADLSKIAQTRALANEFVDLVIRAKYGVSLNPQPFGGTSTRELVDAMILQKVADEAGIPSTPELGEDYLRALGIDISDAKDNALLVNVKSSRYGNSVTSDQLLSAIASQYRLSLAQSLGVVAPVTPLDVYDGYRDRNERIAGVAREFKVEDYLDQVTAQPSEADLQALFNKYKNQLPDANPAEPGFKIPRKVRFAIASIDSQALAQTIRTRLVADDHELREMFQIRKPQIQLDRARAIRNAVAAARWTDLDALPTDLFQGDPTATLTPLTLAMVQNTLVEDLTTERVALTLDERFGVLQTRVVDPFINLYDQAVDRATRSRGRSAEGQEEDPPLDELLEFGLRQGVEQLLSGLGVTPPPIKDGSGVIAAFNAALQAVVQKIEGMQFQVSPAVSRATLAELGPIASSVSGTTYPDPRSGSVPDTSQLFAQMAFEQNTRLFEKLETVDAEGRVYNAWRIADEPARVPSFNEVREQVIAAWRFAEARKLAQAAAEAFLAEVRAKNGDLRAAAGENPVITIAPVTKFVELPNLSPFSAQTTYRANDIFEFVNAGDQLRDAYFKLERPGDAFVAPNAPIDRFYVVAYENRLKAPFNDFVGINNQRERESIQSELLRQTLQEALKARMAELRRNAGLPEDWMPADEAQRQADERRRAERQG